MYLVYAVQPSVTMNEIVQEEISQALEPQYTVAPRWLPLVIITVISIEIES